MSKKIVLSKIFSRERPFFYFSMWDESDRAGFKRFADHDVAHSLFLRAGEEDTGSVWYSTDELSDVYKKIETRFNHNENAWTEVRDVLDREWSALEPYLVAGNVPQTIDDLESYHVHLTGWWSAMTIAFSIPDIGGIDQKIKDAALAYRAEVEKYSDAAHRRYLDFWNQEFPQHKDISYVLLPREAVLIGRGRMSPDDIRKIRSRLVGFALYNNEVLSLPELYIALEKNNVELEQVHIGGTVLKQVAGAPAYPGVVRGVVRIVRFRAQISDVADGDILVTEMTDPDFVPAMKRAAAIVTNEGGVTCHAAIVARELKKPCVIGTKVATSVLKDGDMVEVDAGKGIVRKL